MSTGLDSALSKMPVLIELAGMLKQGGYRFSKDTLAFGVQHIMPQTLALCWALNELGLAYDRVTLCGKPYSTNVDVIEELRRLGVRTNSPRDYTLGKSQAEEQVKDLDGLAADFGELKSTFCGPPIVLIDDGGHALTHFDRFVAPPYTIAGLEQTASGFWQVGVHTVPFPIVDVGASAVKRVCEPALIVEAALDRALPYLPVGHDVRCGIIGMGFIGQALGNALAKRGATLTVYDPRPEVGIPVPARTASSIHELFDHAEIIFGCSGNDTTEELITECKGGLLTPGERTLISLSSGDIEFFALKSAILEQQGALERTYSLEAIPDVRGEHLGATFRIVRNGFPVNFDNEGQSVPLEKIQGTMAALLGASLQAFVHFMQRPHFVHSSSRIMLDRSLQSWLYKAWRPFLANIDDVDFDADIIALSRFRTDPLSLDLGANFPGVFERLQ